MGKYRTPKCWWLSIISHIISYIISFHIQYGISPQESHSLGYTPVSDSPNKWCVLHLQKGEISSGPCLSTRDRYPWLFQPTNSQCCKSLCCYVLRRFSGPGLVLSFLSACLHHVSITSSTAKKLKIIVGGIALGRQDQSFFARSGAIQCMWDSRISCWENHSSDGQIACLLRL